MKIELTSHKPGNTHLILIFAGWSTSPRLYSSISHNDWDVAVAYDYTSFELDTTLLRKYSTIRVFAWSLGVVAAEIALRAAREITISAAYALNGSPFPMHDELGIPENIFRGTSANLNQRNLKKFQRRMAGDSATFSKLFDDEYSDSQIESLRFQLDAISEIRNLTPLLPWKCAYVSDNDLIFPPQNVIRSWEQLGVPVISIAGYHYVDLQNIIDSIIPDKNRIANHFTNAKKTYAKHAEAQKYIAEKLGRIISIEPRRTHCKVLEIGPGTGFLTECYAPYLLPEEIDFVDLMDTQVFGVASKERYFKEDAEKWIKTAEGKYDYIISASTIQWFSDLPEFLRQCQRLIHSDGEIFLSSFLPGNLGELDSIRPTPLLYHSEDEIKKIASSLFENIEIFSEDIKLNFPSVRHLLLHLKHTGVSGGFSTQSSVKWSELEPTLTYRPVYIRLSSPMNV